MKRTVLLFLLLTICSRAAVEPGKPGTAISTKDRLKASSGLVDVRFVLPDEWPADKDQTLFHVGDKGHTHVTLFCRRGTLIAVYKADKEHYASVTYAAARLWKAGGAHRVQFQWKAEGEDVPCYLRVDDKLVGTCSGRLIKEWPAQCYIGIRGKRSPWSGTISKAIFVADPPTLSESKTGSRRITIDATQVEGKIYNFWSIANYTRQDLFAGKAFQSRQKFSHPFMRYVNCVRLLGGRPDGRNRWFKGVDAEGRPIVDFSGMIGILQGIMDAGYTPRIVLDNVPLEMSGNVQMEKYGNTHPPKDYRIWDAYIEGAVQAMVDAFGKKQVSAWRFRVGTEPDLKPGHWIGTAEQYKRHYAHTVAAVQKVIPDPDIGPGNILDTKHAEWGLDLVDFIAEKNLPMKYFSCSWYGRVGGTQDGFETNIAAMRSRLDGYERFQKIPLEIAEFAILHDERGQRLWCGDTTEWGASWYAGIADKVYRLNVAQIHQWATTTSGLHHPRSHLHTMLGKMNGERLNVSVDDVDSAALAGAIAARKDGAVFVLLYNHRFQRKPNVSETIHLKINDSRMKMRDDWFVDEWRVDRNHGVFIYAFNEDCRNAGLTPLPKSARFEGSPRLRWGPEGMHILKKNFKKYVRLSVLPKTREHEKLQVKDGSMEMTVEMPGHSVRLLKLSP